MTAIAPSNLVSRRGPQAGRLDEPLKAKTSRRNGQATRQRILEAAFVEFAAAGLAGARVDRIAAAAECNKSLIFVYFESKAALFEAVVGKELERIDTEVGLSTEDAVEFAARLFDFAMAHPKSMRLLSWYGLETEAHSRPERPISASSYRLDLRPADHLSDSLPPDFLPTAVIALSTAWSQGNLIGHVLASRQMCETGALRHAVLDGVKRLTE